MTLAATKERPPPCPIKEPFPFSTGDCRIKENISSKGDRIHHVPGGRFYERTRIDTSRG